jgi:hypothetical protein
MARWAGRAQAPAGHSPRPDWQLRLSTLRRTAGCRPCVTPDTACPQSAAVTPTERAMRGPPSSRRSSLEPTKITVKSAPACGLRVLRMALRATLDCDLARHMIAPIRRMARTDVAR